MVFDASAKPHYLASSINNCMHRGPPLQPLLWDVLVRARMSPNLLLGDIEKAFLQIGIKEEDRDAFRFLFTLKGKEERFRFTSTLRSRSKPLHTGCHVTPPLRTTDRGVQGHSRHTPRKYLRGQLDEDWSPIRRNEEIQERSHPDLRKCEVPCPQMGIQHPRTRK